MGEVDTGLDQVTCGHVTEIDEKNQGSGQARGNPPASSGPLLPSDSPSSFLLHQHGYSNHSSPCSLFLSSSLTMAISTASIVCSLRPSHRIPSHHLYRRLIVREHPRVLFVTLTVLQLTVVLSLKPFFPAHLYPDLCTQRLQHLHQHK